MENNTLAWENCLHFFCQSEALSITYALIDISQQLSVKIRFSLGLNSNVVQFLNSVLNSFRLIMI